MDQNRDPQGKTGPKSGSAKLHGKLPFDNASSGLSHKAQCKKLKLSSWVQKLPLALPLWKVHSKAPSRRRGFS